MLNFDHNIGGILIYYFSDGVDVCRVAHGFSGHILRIVSDYSKSGRLESLEYFPAIIWWVNHLEVTWKSYDRSDVCFIDAKLRF